MSGFSGDWLALREPADHAARDCRVQALVEATFAERDDVSILDLACGAGSNVRAQASRLPRRQRWRLVDHDEALLAAARAALVAWADRVDSDAPLVLLKADRRLEVSLEPIDLGLFDRAVLGDAPDLVTTAAFLDLVSATWIERFCDELERRRLPLYATLSYEGRERWKPAHLADEAMLEAFLRHQVRDKGFGPAAGPGAALLLQDALEKRGYAVERGASPWRLGRSDAGLIGALVDGSAQAVIETGLVPEATIEDWRAFRRGSTSCEIDHVDIFAQWQGATGSWTRVASTALAASTKPAPPGPSVIHRGGTGMSDRKRRTVLTPMV
jgi:hypothetical protein